MKLLLTFVILLNTSLSLAALPPKYQNDKDLNVIVNFIKQHPKIIASLKTIDFGSKTIHFDENCIVNFGRKNIKRADGWVGPAAGLEFKKSNCELDYPE